MSFSKHFLNQKIDKISNSLSKIFNKVSSENTFHIGISLLKQLFYENLQNEKNMNYLFQKIQYQLLNLKKENKKNIINILPHICSKLQKKIFPYIDRILSIFQSSICDDTKGIFQLIAKNFGQCSKILISISDNNINNISSSEIPLDILLVYTQFKLFCLTNIKSQSHNNQTFGILCLNNFIENCSFNYKNNENLKFIWENLIYQIDKNTFYPKIELLNCLISLIFLSEKKFSSFCTITLYKIIDFITNKDWVIRKLALNIIYALVYYCKDEIYPLKSFLLEFLQSVKNDKNLEVKEVCIQIINRLNDENNNYPLFNFNNNNIISINSSTSLSDQSTINSGKLSNVSSQIDTKKSNINLLSSNFSFSNISNDNINNQNNIKVIKKQKIESKSKKNSVIQNNKTKKLGIKEYIKIKTMNNYHSVSNNYSYENIEQNNFPKNVKIKKTNINSNLYPTNIKRNVINIKNKYNTNNIKHNSKIKIHKRSNSTIYSTEKIKKDIIKKNNLNILNKNHIINDNNSSKKKPKTPSFSNLKKKKIQEFIEYNSFDFSFNKKGKISLKKENKINTSYSKKSHINTNSSFSNEKPLNNSCIFSKYNKDLKIKNSPIIEKSINDNYLNETSRTIKDNLICEIEKLKSQISSLNLEIAILRDKKNIKNEIREFIKNENYIKAFELACNEKNIQELYYIIRHYQLNCYSSSNYDKYNQYNLNNELLENILIVLSEDLLECENLLVITNFIIKNILEKKREINKYVGTKFGNAFNELYFKRMELGLSKEEIENIYQIVNYFINY